MSLFITEIESDYDRIVYCDMDGVLCNWLDGFKKISGGISEKDYRAKYGKPASKKLVNNAGSEWWSNLEWMPDGRTLWSFLRENFLNLKILSATGTDGMNWDKNAINGKLTWLNKHITGISENDIHFVEDGLDKAKLYARTTDVLIDDMPKNTKAWSQMGGIAITHTSASDTINKLKELV